MSWLRSDGPWVKPRKDDDDDRFLNLHWFNTGREDDGDPEEPARFRMANFIPGGKFVVILYATGHIDLKEIEIKSEDEWDLRDVARYKRDDPGRCYTMFWSQLLTETNLGRPLVAYVDQRQEEYGCSSSLGPSTPY